MILDGTFCIRNEFRMFRNGLAMTPDAADYVHCCIHSLGKKEQTINLLLVHKQIS